MADLSITAANVAKGTGAQIDYSHTAAVTITQGQSVYLDSTITPAQYKLAQGTTAVLAAAAGVSLNSALAGQPIAVQTGGVYTVGATLVTGQTYCVSAAVAGNIAPISDIVATNFSTILFIATSTLLGSIGIVASGVAHG